MIRDASEVSRRRLNSRVNTAAIEVRKVKRSGRLVVRPLLTMPVCKSRISANLHPQRFVLPLAMAGTNPVLIRVANDCRFIDRKYLAGRITPGRSLLGRRAEYLDDLSMVDVRPKDFAYGARVRIKTVRGQLKAIRPGGLTQLLREL